jgi:hypothetical protein
MSLNLEKLEMVRKLPGGAIQARCPACAEGGADRTGNHLRIRPDGRFGCCVHPKDGDHRKRIFALAGARDRQAIRVTVGGPKVAKIIQSDVLGRLGRVFSTPNGTTAPNITTLGTLGTPQYILGSNQQIIIHTCKDFPTGVPSVPEQQVAFDFKTPVPSVPSEQPTPTPEKGVPRAKSPGTNFPDQPPSPVKLPYLTADGTLVIPFDSPERYHWWKPDGERLSVEQIRAEVETSNNQHRTSNIQKQEHHATDIRTAAP